MKKHSYLIIFCLFICTLVIFNNKRRSKRAESLTVVTYSGFNIGKDTIKIFEDKYDTKVKFIQANGIEVALNQSILSKNHPMADIFFGIDSMLLKKAIQEEIFEAYNSPMLEKIPNKLKLDPQNRLLPVTFGDICLNYDLGWFKKHKLSPPSSLEDLLKPEYKGLTVVPNPEISPIGFAFLLTTIGHFGEDGFLEFWKKLRDNDVLIASSWKDSNMNRFSATSKGSKPIAVSYCTTPVKSRSPVKTILENKSTYRQIEFVGILKGTKKLELAKKFVDFMLSKTYQKEIPLKQFMLPANKEATLPEIFKKNAKCAKNPVTIQPESNTLKRKWLDKWTKIALR